MLTPMTDADRRWSFSNPGPEMLAIWLKPWAEEIEVPVRSTVTMESIGGSEETAPGEIEWTPDHLVVWANVETIRVFVDGVLQDTCSAGISAPEGLTRALLNIAFAGQPAARLGGAYAGLVRPDGSWWAKLKRRSA